jgi:glycosyltransferase involved in cell wall biosynthesis
MKLADLVMLDTHANIEYVTGLFELDRKKFLRLFVGADEKIFYRREDRPSEEGIFRVLFFGKFIPLHGVHHILYAAKELEADQEIRFQIIGRGQLSDEIHKLAKKLRLRNVDFIDWVDYEDLPQYIHDAHVCLGIFGDSEKAQRVIPNKVFQCLAMEKPVVTALSPASLELIVSGEHGILCEPPFAQAIKKSVKQLKQNALLRQRLAVNGGKLFEGNLNSVRMVSKLADVLRSRMGSTFCEAPR